MSYALASDDTLRARVADIVGTVLGAPIFSTAYDAPLIEQGADSMHFLLICFALEEEFGVRLPTWLANPDLQSINVFAANVATLVRAE